MRWTRADFKKKQGKADFLRTAAIGGGGRDEPAPPKALDMRDLSAHIVPIRFPFPPLSPSTGAALFLLAWALGGRLLRSSRPRARCCCCVLPLALLRWLIGTTSTRTTHKNTLQHGARCGVRNGAAVRTQRQTSVPHKQLRPRPHASVPTPRSTACIAGTAVGAWTPESQH
jgi:hypothetical protein